MKFGFIDNMLTRQSSQWKSKNFLRPKTSKVGEIKCESHVS